MMQSYMINRLKMTNKKQYYDSITVYNLYYLIFKTQTIIRVCKPPMLGFYFNT